tara:strand:+ start:43 stop:1179 length:1137 start_codon:yes stop_codon:yes gene_type:complete
MADRILKPDSGNDLVLQNDDASAKIEINEAGTIVATPSLQVDNIKIDGTTISSTGSGAVDINLTTLGTGEIVVSGASEAKISAGASQDIILKTQGNVSKIQIHEGADANIDITPHGTGEVNISKVDIDSGAIDAVTLGTNSAVTEAQIDNININGNAITSSNTDGNIDLTPNGTGEVNITKVDIDGGSIDGVTIGDSNTFPDGFVTNVINRKLEIANGAAASAFTNNTTGERIFSRTSSSSTTVPSFTAKQGYTYIITLSFFAIMSATGGNTSGRVADFMLYVGNTSRSQGDSTVDTFLNEVRGGRNLVSATSAGTSSYLAINLTGSFYQSSADATTYYYGSSLTGSTDKQVLNYMSATHPMYEKIVEVKGNVLTKTN